MQRTSIYDGYDLPSLQGILAKLQQARLDLLTGGKGESYSYSQGDGAKSVTYTRANADRLTMEIVAVQTAIDRLTGVRLNRRAPMRPVF